MNKLSKFSTIAVLGLSLLLTGLGAKTVMAEETESKVYEVEQNGDRTELILKKTTTYSYGDGDTYTDTYNNTILSYYMSDYDTSFDVRTSLPTTNRWTNYAGGARYVEINVQNYSSDPNENYTITNLKSSNANIKAKLTGVKYDSQREYIRRYNISYYGKKAGTSTISFDVINNGAVVKTMSFTVTANNPEVYTVSKTKIKSVTYNGKDIYSSDYYPIVRQKSGKLKVTPIKGYSLVSIKCAINYNYNASADSYYDYFKYKKVKNNSKIKLLSSQKYTSSTDSATRNELFVDTPIIITVKNNKTKKTYTECRSLYTLNTK